MSNNVESHASVINQILTYLSSVDPRNIQALSLACFGADHSMVTIASGSPIEIMGLGHMIQQASLHNAGMGPTPMPADPRLIR